MWACGWGGVFSKMTDAFADEVVALMPDMRAYACSLTRSRSDADDLVQEAFVRAWRSRSRFAEGTNLRAWLFTILRNRFYSRAIEGRRLVQDVDGLHAAQLASPPDQGWRLEFGEAVRAIGDLSQQGRDALILVLVSGLSYEEAAQACECPVGTMKSRVNRARDRLVERLDNPMGRAPAAFA